jgi:alpha-L-rhamnosidase
MAEMAEAIGEHLDAAAFRDRAKQITVAFAKILVDADGRIKDSSQTGYALAFSMGLVPPNLKTQMSARFSEEITRFNGHLATGFIGTPRLLPALRLAGRDDLAYQLLLNESYPSWLFQVKNGATTMWERWDGWHPEKGYADSGMNSFNHYAFGACAGYIFSTIGGIQAETPGYQRILIQPVIQQGLTWTRTRYDSIRGRIATAWKVEGNRIQLDVTIPANTEATIYVPAHDAADITESDKPAMEAEGLQFQRMEGSCAVFTAGSGEYHFQSQQPRDAMP